MKKRILVGCLLFVPVYGATFNTIEQAAINNARQTIEHEFDVVHKKRCVVAGLGMAVLCAGIYGSWKTIMLEGQTLRRASQADDGVKKGYSDFSEPSAGRISRMVKWMGDSTSSALSVVPVLTASYFVNSTLSAGFGYMYSMAARLYRPLSWQWMTCERAPLAPLAQGLKQCAAVLDPSSELFSLLAQVKINWEGPCSVMTADGWIQVSTFDDLVKMRLLAQAVPAGARAVYEQQVTQMWNHLVDQLVLCLGFIAYKQQARIESEFDARQLAAMSAHLILSTNTLAKQLPELMNTQNKQQSSGLLVALYRYSTDLLHCCELLTSNSIVAG